MKTGSFVKKFELTKKIINDGRIIFTKKNLDRNPELLEWCKLHVGKPIHYSGNEKRLSNGNGSELSIYNKNSYRISIGSFLKNLMNVNDIIEIWIEFSENKMKLSQNELIIHNSTQKIEQLSPMDELLNNFDTNVDYDHFSYGNIFSNKLMNHEPTNEIGVIYLFSLYAAKNNIIINSFSERKYPDAVALFPGNNERNKKRFIEFEYKSSGFRKHLSDESHIIKNVNFKDILVVCWINDFKDCPAEVFCLRDKLIN